jgi:hypothetical protein
MARLMEMLRRRVERVPVTAMVKERRRVTPLGWRQRWALVSPKLLQSRLVARSAPGAVV